MRLEDLFLSSLNDTFGQTPEFFSTWSFPEGWVMMTVGFPKLNGQREGEKERQKDKYQFRWQLKCILLPNLGSENHHFVGHTGQAWYIVRNDTKKCDCQEVRSSGATWPLVAVPLLSFSQSGSEAGLTHCCGSITSFKVIFMHPTWAGGWGGRWAWGWDGEYM